MQAMIPVKIIFGRETSSSSSHAFSLVPQKISRKITDKEWPISVSLGEFGWEEFKIKRIETLLSYIATQMIYNIKLSSISLPFELIVPQDYYVDHQSVWQLHGSEDSQRGLFEFLLKEAMQGNIQIETGNDNNDESPIRDMKEPLNLLFADSCFVSMPGENTFVLISEPEYKRSSIKVRIGEHSQKYPESIDLKITEACVAGCAFCSEDAIEQGRFCSFENYKELIDNISGFTGEVVLGGGNPLLHPELLKMIQYAKERNVLSAVTARDIDFIVWPGLLDLLEYAKIGVSFTTISSLQYLKRIVQQENFTVHVINGIHAIEDIKNIMSVTDCPILVLGFKDRGRGIHYVTKPYLNFDALRSLGEQRGVQITFDTLATKQLNIQSQVNSEEWQNFFDGWDGDHSMYIDLVKKEFSVSSYDTGRRKLDDPICIDKEFGKCRLS